MKAAGLFALFLVCGPSSGAVADTLYLRVGTTLKIESFSCDVALCVAAVKGGDVRLRPADVVRVEPDEEVDVEPAMLSAGSQKGASDPATDSARTIEHPTIEQMIADAARRYALPRSLVRAVARAESALNPAAISRRGARGVMQLMPGTAKDLGVQNAFDPEENIHAGARLLRQLLEKYEGRVAEALAAYNAGPGAVARAKGVPPYRETRGYIRKIVSDFEKAEKKGEATPPGREQ